MDIPLTIFFLKVACLVCLSIFLSSYYGLIFHKNCHSAKGGVKRKKMQAKTLKEAAELLPKFLLVKNGKYIPTDNNRHEDYFELSIITNEIVFYQGKGKSIYQMDLVTPIIEFDFLNAFLELHQKLITNSIL